MNTTTRRRTTSVLVTLALTAALTTADFANRTDAGAEVGSLPDGTEVEVVITSPPDGSQVVGGSVQLEGTTRVGAGDSEPDTALVMVLDLSGSTFTAANGDCGGDQNGDGRLDTVMDCEVAAGKALTDTAISLGSVSEIGISVYENQGGAGDVQPASGRQLLTAPDADLNANSVLDVHEVLQSAYNRTQWIFVDAGLDLFARTRVGRFPGGTNFAGGLTAACDTLAASSQPNRLIVFMSDGEANQGGNVSTVLPCSLPTVVHTFAVGASSTCAANPTGRGSLQDIADLTGGTCTQVVNPEDLPDLLSELISPEIYRLGLTIDGGPEIDISAFADTTLPAPGPDPVGFSYLVEGLSGSTNELCVTTYARNGTDETTVTDCITVISNRPPVADAGPDQAVDEGGFITVDGSGSSDPDGDALTYSWQLVQASGPPLFLTSTDDPVVGFQSSDDGTYVFELTVSDGTASDTDEVTIDVGNVAPVVDAQADPAAEGGVALLTSSFTDPGFLDTHQATIDWGDGSAPEAIAVSAQGTGWGSLFATHVYETAGTFTATVTVVDDDGGSGAATAVSVEVAPSLAVWANSETASRTIDWRGGTGSIIGLVHTNNELRVRGADKLFDGPVEHAGALDVSNNVTFTVPPTQVAAADYPIRFELADYRPGGRAAIDAGEAYFDMSGACGNRWDPSGPLDPGLYYAPCDVKLNAGALTGLVTIAAEGDIQVAGSDADFEPFIDGLLFLSGSDGNKAIQISSSGASYLGYLFAETGRIDVAGSGNRYYCGLLADRLDITDSGLEIRASDCVRPERTVAPPTLVPALDLAVENSRDDALPGDVVTTTATLTNTGALLLVPGVIGLENLGDAPVTVTSVSVGIEYRSAATGAWVPLAEPATLVTTPNPAPGVTFPAGGDQVTGTVIDPDALATWGAELQLTLPPGTAQLLLDPAQATEVRNVVEFDLDNPSGEPVRRLFRFGNDFAPELRDLGASLTDITATVTTVDGTNTAFDSSTAPALAELGPGDAAVVAAGADVPVPALRGGSETSEGYLARLASLDGTELGAGAFAISSGGVGLVLGAQQFDTTTRHVPRVTVELSGPADARAGELVHYDLTLRSLGSVDALALDAGAAVDGASATIDGVPADLAAGEIAVAGIDHQLAPDALPNPIDVAASLDWQDANGNPYGTTTATARTAVAEPPQLQALLADSLLVDADGSGLPSAGDTIRYTATITNTGGTAVAGVAFAVDVDPNSTLVPGSVAAAPGTVLDGNDPGDTTVGVDVGSLGAATSSEITFDVDIDDPFTGPQSRLEVQGDVTSADLPPLVTDDPGEPGVADPTITLVVPSDAALTAVLAADLLVDADGDGGPSEGDTLRFAAVIDSIGLSQVNNVTFSLTPDPNTTIVPGSVETTAGTVTGGNGAGDTTITVDIGSLAGLDRATVGFELVVDDPLAPGVTSISNQGTISSDELADLLTSDARSPGSGDPTVTLVGSSTTGGPGGGGPAPTFDGVTPAEGTVVTSTIDVSATPTPPAGTTIDSWRVIAFPSGGDPADGIELASGTGGPPAGALATFDSTVVSNGPWVLRVEATDSDGGVGIADTTVIVEGNLKLGRFSTSYLDMAVPVGGLPIRVLRTYDTLDRTTSGDFGFGWNVDLGDFRVSTNGPLGLGGWEQYGCGGGLIFVPICYRTNKPHFVTVTWPDGRTETFDLTPGEGSTFFPILTTAAYTGRSGTTSELLPAPGDISLTFFNDGTGNLLGGGFGSGGVYDPQRFVLRALDGTEYLLDRDTGLVSATNADGATLTVSDAGVVSSLGPSLDFVRDAQGRITSIVGPSGETVTYTYDADGNLATVTDQVGNVTSLGYDAGHYLTTIDDPGPGALQTLTYGPDGRVQSITDANGNTTQVDFDLDARTETVTSPDGLLITVRTLDERGNVLSEDRIHDGQSHVNSYTYDAGDRVTSRTDPLGATTTSVYDADGNLLSRTDATGATSTATYDDRGFPTTVTDRSGATTTYEYTAGGNYERIVDPLGGVRQFTYNAAGDMTSFTDELGHTTTWTYDSAGRLATEVDAAGNTTTWGYDASGRVTTITDALGGVTAYAYDAAGDLTSITDPLGRTSSFAYDGSRRLVSETDPTGATTTYQYDAAGNLTAVTDPTGDSIVRAYAFGRLATEQAPDGGVFTYDYDGAGQLIQSVDPMGSTTTYAYDLAGRRTTETVDTGSGPATTTTTYDANGAVASVTDAEGGTTGYGRDGMGRPLSVTDPIGRVSTSVYDAIGRLTVETNSAGESVTYTYDAAGRLIAVTDPTGAVTAYTYDPVGNLASTVDPLGRTVTFGYDALNRQVTTTDPLGAVSTSTYDAAGQLVQQSSAAGITVDMAYDPAGRLVTVTDALGASITTAYDPAGRLASRTDANGNTTVWTYDPSGRVASETDPLGGTVAYTYDLAGRQTSVTDANGATRTFGYDPAGNVTSITDPIGRTTSMGYDRLSRLTSITDGRGTTIGFSLDAAGQLVSETSPDGTVAYTYDAAGRRTSMTDPTGTTTWGYDAAGRTTTTATPAGTLGYDFDAAGQLAELSRPEGTVAYTYDARGMLATIEDWNGDTTSFATDPDGRVTSVARPNGVTTTHGYDPAGRLVDIAHTGPGGTIESFDYTLDAVGNRTGVTTAAGVESYDFDALDRLTQASYPGGDVTSYTYDAAGNRTSLTANAVTVSYTYDAAGQLVSDSSGTAYSYDGAGNLTATSTGDSFGYDAYGRLASAAVGGSTQTFAYDGDGVRVVVDGAPQLWDRRDLPRLLSDGSDSYLHSPLGYLSTPDAGGTTYGLADALGSVRASTDAAGAVVSTATYDAFGDLRTGSTGTFGFTGEQLDPTGLIHLRARAYDPGVGRFLTPDPVQPNAFGSQGWNLYSYVGNNPTTLVDPTGTNSTGYVIVLGVALTAFEAALLLGLLLATLLSIQIQVCTVNGTCPDIPIPDIDWPWNRPSRPRPGQGGGGSGGGAGAGAGALAEAIAAGATISITEAIAVAVAATCAAMTVNAALGRGDNPCGTEDLFITGGDVMEATDHDIEAMLAGKPFALSRQRPPHDRAWLRNVPGVCPSPRPAGQQCDEYPFAAAQQGGQANDPSLKLIKSFDNEEQGRRLNWTLYDPCGVHHGDDYLVVPVPEARVPTFGVCG